MEAGAAVEAEAAVAEERGEAEGEGRKSAGSSSGVTASLASRDPIQQRIFWPEFWV